MFKALALENVWAPVFAKSKPHVIKKETAGNVRVWIAALLVVANAALLMSYVYGVNEYAAQGYQIKVLQAKLSGLSDQNKQLSLKVSEAASMVSIQNDFLSANFVPAGTPKFLQTGGVQLTQR